MNERSSWIKSCSNKGQRRKGFLKKLKSSNPKSKLRLMKLPALKRTTNIKCKSVRPSRERSGSPLNALKLPKQRLEIYYSKSLRRHWKLPVKLRGLKWKSTCTKKGLIKQLLTWTCKRVKYKIFRTSFWRHRLARTHHTRTSFSNLTIKGETTKRSTAMSWADYSKK